MLRVQECLFLADTFQAVEKMASQRCSLAKRKPPSVDAMHHSVNSAVPSSAVSSRHSSSLYRKSPASAQPPSLASEGERSSADTHSGSGDDQSGCEGCDALSRLHSDDVSDCRLLTGSPNLRHRQEVMFAEESLLAVQKQSTLLRTDYDYLSLGASILPFVLFLVLQWVWKTG